MLRVRQVETKLFVRIIDRKHRPIDFIRSIDTLDFENYLPRIVSFARAEILWFLFVRQLIWPDHIIRWNKPPIAFMLLDQFWPERRIKNGAQASTIRGFTFTEICTHLSVCGKRVKFMGWFQKQNWLEVFSSKVREYKLLDHRTTNAQESELLGPHFWDAINFWFN